MTGALTERVLADLPESPARAEAVARAAGTARLAEDARRFGLHPLLSWYLPGAVPESPPEKYAAAFRYERLLADTLAASDALAGAGIRAVVLKGVSLAERAYPEPSLRPSTDVDLLVAPADLVRARPVLERLGYTLVKDLPDTPDRFSHHQVFAAARKLPIELHFTASEKFQARFATDELLARAVPLPVRGTTIRVLDPADELVHLCVHAASHFFEGVKWLFDLKLLLARQEPRWREVVRRARAAGLAAATGLTLRIARGRVRARVPDSVVDELGPGELRRLVARRLVSAKPSIRSWLLELALADRLSRAWVIRLTAPALQRVARAGGLERRLADLWRTRSTREAAQGRGGERTAQGRQRSTEI